MEMKCELDWTKWHPMAKDPVNGCFKCEVVSPSDRMQYVVEYTDTSCRKTIFSPYVASDGAGHANALCVYEVSAPLVGGGGEARRR